MFTNTFSSSLRTCALLVSTFVLMMVMLGVAAQPARAQTTIDSFDRESLIQLVNQLIAQIFAQQQLEEVTLTLSELSNQTQGLEGGFTVRGIGVTDLVQTTDDLRVRAVPGGQLLDSVPPFTQGTVIDGPEAQGEHDWWEVRYSTGLTGWSAEPWLRKLSEQPSIESPVLISNPYPTSNPSPYTGDFGDSLSLRSSSFDPDATTFALESDDQTEHVVFAVEFDASRSDNDIYVEELFFNVFLGGKDGTSLRDLVDDARLLVDGDEINQDVDILNDGVLFYFDNDFMIRDGERVDAVLELTFDELDPQFEGYSISIMLNGSSVRAEGDGPLFELPGGVAGATHLLRTTGLLFDQNFSNGEGLESSFTLLENSDATSADDEGLFEVTFEVTAFEEDYFINDRAAVRANDLFSAQQFGAGFLFDILQDGQVVEKDGDVDSITAAVVGSTADQERSGRYRVDEGESEEFIIRLTFDPRSSGSYKVRLNGVAASQNDNNPTEYFTANPVANFETNEEFIPGSGTIDNENGDSLVVRTSSFDPDATTFFLEEDEEVTYEVFAFELDASDSQNDVEVEALAIAANLPDVKAGFWSDYIDDVRLIVDGVEYDDFEIYSPRNSSGYVIQFDLDLLLEAGQRADAVLEIDFDLQVEITSLASSGNPNYQPSIQFSITGGAIEAEGDDEIFVAGSVAGSRHSLRAEEGVEVEFVKESTTLFTNDDATISDDAGQFEIAVDITAGDSDIYIPIGDYSNAPNAGFTYSIVSGNIILGVSSSDIDTGFMSFTSTADKKNNRQYLVREGDTETFTITVMVDPVRAANYKMELDSVRYYTDGAKQANLTEQNITSQSIQTDTLFIDGTGVPRNGTAPTCTVSVDKKTYQENDRLVVSWSSKNTSYMRFVTSDGPKDNIRVPSGKYEKSGSAVLVTNGISGRPTITMQAFGVNGRKVNCSVSFNVEEENVAQIEFEGSDTTLNTNDDATVSDDSGEFELEFSITAGDNDIFISTKAENSLSPRFQDENSLRYITKNSKNNGLGVSGANLDFGTQGLRSTADTEDGYYRIDEGETETFTLTVIVDPVAGDSYQVQMESPLRFLDRKNVAYEVEFDELKFSTDFVRIDGTGTPRNGTFPSCVITTDKTTYTTGDRIVASWSSNNARSMKFIQPDSGYKDAIEVPTRSQRLQGGYVLEASVSGQPTIEMRATDSNGRTADCKVQIQVVEEVVTQTNPVYNSRIAAPGRIAHRCSQDGTEITFTWNKVSGYDTYYFRMQETESEKRLNWDNAVKATSKKVSVVPGQSYDWWVHAKDDNGDWGRAARVNNISCDAPTAATNVDVEIQRSVNGGAWSPYDATVTKGDTVKITWSSKNAKSCKVSQVNGRTISFAENDNFGTGRGVSINVPGQSYTYEISCDNGAASDRVVLYTAPEVEAEVEKGTYKVYIDGQLAVTAQDVERSYAVNSCKSGEKDPDKSYRCTWNNIEVYKVDATASVPEEVTEEVAEVVVPAVTGPIPVPTRPSHACSADGKTLTMNWRAPSGYDTFYFRMQDNKTGQRINWDENLRATTKKVSVTPGQPYTWWVHTKRTSDNKWSTSVKELNVVCDAPVVAAPTVAKGTYLGYLDNRQFIRTANISQADALANCKLNARNNSTKSVRCTWNGGEIYKAEGEKVATPVAVKAQSDVSLPMPTRPMHVCRNDNTRMIMRWGGPTGYDNFYFRMRESVTKERMNWVEKHPNTSRSVDVEPGVKYDWWVHTRDDATGNWSKHTGEYGVACGGAVLGASISVYEVRAEIVERLEEIKDRLEVLHR